MLGMGTTVRRRRVYDVQAIIALADGRRGPSFNHYKTAAEGLMGLTWPLCSTPNSGASTSPDSAQKCPTFAVFRSYSRNYRGCVRGCQL